MAQVIFTIPDSAIDRVIDDIAIVYDYDDRGGNLTKAQFARQVIIQFIKRTCREAEGRLAGDAAREAANSEIVIT